MLDNYDIKNLNPRKNPYVSKEKQQVTIKLDNNVVVYFKSMAEDTGIPYQTLINMYLSDCVKEKKKLTKLSKRLYNSTKRILLFLYIKH